MRRLTHSLLAAVFVAALCAATGARAQNAAAPAKGPGMEPDAVAVLKAMAETLKSAKTIAFTAETTYEAPAMNGQTLWYTTISEVLLQRPNHLRVLTPGDGPPTEFYYDGKTVTAFDPAANLVAVADAPPKLDAMLDFIKEKSATYYPFLDMLGDDPEGVILEGLSWAYLVGQSHIVGGTETDMIAFGGEAIQGEVWIGAKDHLPRLVRVTYPKAPFRGTHTVAFGNWRLGGDVKLPGGAFASAKAAKAGKIPFGRPDTEPAKPQ